MASTMKALVMIAACLGMVAGQAFTVLNQEDTKLHTDCHSLYKAGYVNNGTYKLTHEGQEYFVPCEFRNGYGYTIFLNRVDNYINWERSYADYETGFGYPVHDYFSGLYLLNKLTHSARTALEVYFSDWDGTDHKAINSHFYVGDRSTGYQLSVGGAFVGNVPNDMGYNNGQRFYTIDHPDPHRCVNQQRGGWWYYYCSKALPTGHYYNQGPYTTNKTLADGIYWTGYRQGLWSLKKFVMAVRPTQ